MKTTIKQIALLLLFLVAQLNAQTKPAPTPQSVAGIYSSNLGEDNIIVKASSDTPTTLKYEITTVAFELVYDEELTKKTKGKLAYRSIAIPGYYCIQLKPGVLAHLMCIDGIKLDGTDWVQYILVKNKAELANFKEDVVKKQLTIK